MTTALGDLRGPDPRSAQGWTLSIVLHLVAIGLAVAFLSDLHLAAQPEAFRWQVSVIAPTKSSDVQDTAAPPMEPPPAPPTLAAPSPSTPAPASKPQPNRRQSAAPQTAAPDLPSPTALQRPPQSAAQKTRAVPPPVTPPVEPRRSDPSQIVAPPPSLSPPPVNESAASSSREPPLPHAFSAPPEAPPPSDPANVPAIARETVEAPSIAAPPAHQPETVSSATPSSTMPPAIQEARIGKPDFSWLSDSLRTKVQESQRYSTVARLNGLEGRVMLRITVKENGELIVAITKSSGHDILDQDAVEQVKRLSPLPLLKPLGRAQQILNLPIIYSLHQ